ncbi:MAG: putative sugar O-methyltransferase [Candidatus Omnitrophica bacterium]|nr:putative sugar O-methyltransferase [Candidatus Omnitrophota bacterium]
MIVEKTTPLNNDILNELFIKYYCLKGYSSVTSSHWQKYGAMNVVEKTAEGFLVSGQGFGHFVRTGTLRSIKHYPAAFLAQGLLKAHGVDSTVRACGEDVARKQKRQVNFDEVKQIIMGHILKASGVLEKTKTVAVIGDGYGFMSCLLRQLLPQTTIISVNLGKMLFFDMLYVAKVFPDNKMFLWRDDREYLSYLKAPSMVFLEAERCALLSSRGIDLFINIASMQEMNPDVIGMYFDIIRSGAGEKYFYCCNWEEKTLPDQTVIRFNEYPWDAKKDEILFDELCPFYQKYPVSRPPFWLPFDGPIRHRLVKMGRS